MHEIENNFKLLLLDVEEQLNGALDAVENPAPATVAKVEARDDYLDNYKSVIENAAFSHIHGTYDAKSPQTNYLRALVVAASNLERLGDHCVNVARQTQYFQAPDFMHHFAYRPLFDEVRAAIRMVHDALFKRDMNKALGICRAELTLDSLYKTEFDNILKQLRTGPKAGDFITAIFIFRYLERMGDALLNIGEASIFAITGNKFKIRQFNALNDALAGDLVEEDRKEARLPMNEVEFSSIWGSRSGCRIGRVRQKEDRQGAGDVIFKDGDPKKLLEEAASIERWEKLMPGLPPRVVALQEHEKSTSMLVEALPGNTVQDVILSASMKEIKCCMDVMASTMRELWLRSKKDDSIKAGFVKQIKKRLPGVLKVHPDFAKRDLNLAGASFKPLDEVLATAASIEEGLQAPFSVFIHGDCNSNNIIYRAHEERIHYIDLHRSKESDFCQDVSVFLLSNFRLPVFDSIRRNCIEQVSFAFLDFARRFAADQGDTTFEARLNLGLARSFMTSTRFELNRRFAKLMFLRGIYLLEHIARHTSKDNCDFTGFRVPDSVLRYP